MHLKSQTLNLRSRSKTVNLHIRSETLNLHIISETLPLQSYILDKQLIIVLLVLEGLKIRLD